MQQLVVQETYLHDAIKLCQTHLGVDLLEEFLGASTWTLNIAPGIEDSFTSDAAPEAIFQPSTARFFSMTAFKRVAEIQIYIEGVELQAEVHAQMVDELASNLERRHAKAIYIHLAARVWEHISGRGLIDRSQNGKRLSVGQSV